MFQLFEPIFDDLLCPDIYYFSSTDQSLQFSEIMNKRDYVYVHFLQRIEQYDKTGKYKTKLKIGDLDKLSTGVIFSGANLYVLSEKYYLMYGHDIFYNNVMKKVKDFPQKMMQK